MKLSDILIISDLDGTLLTDEKTITQKNIGAIAKFRELGGRFTVATGRSTLSAEQYIDIVKCDTPTILFNGVVIYDFGTKKMIWNTYLQCEKEKIVKEIYDNLPNAGIEIMCEGEIFVPRTNEAVKAHLDLEGLEYKMIDIDDLPTEKWLKILFAMDSEYMQEIQEFTDEKQYENVTFLPTSENFFEMLPVGNSKGEAMTHLAEKMGIDISNIVAVGDFNNDIEMVKLAGLGVAMGNAIDGLKQVADITVKSNENDGIADLIEYLINNYK